MDMRQSPAKLPKFQGVADRLDWPCEELGYSGSDAMKRGVTRGAIVHGDGPPLRATFQARQSHNPFGRAQFQSANAHAVTKRDAPDPGRRSAATAPVADP